MSATLSSNTQALLLLTAPLNAGGAEPSPDLLTPSVYNRVERILRDGGHEPGDLLGPDAAELVKKCAQVVEDSRLERLLGRGFLLSQAFERWQARSIWVVGRWDSGYPARFTERLKDDAPAVLYGCGDPAVLDTGGLAIVGSRHVEDALVEYTENVGRLAARAQRTVVSGGARGIDQAAMRGALREGGAVSGVLADSLERAALVREHREVLMDGRLALISPYDPLAGFNVGHAMQRNKLIYALADAALVVSSDYEKGGTWAGAVEQLDKLSFVPVYVRAEAHLSKGLEALRKKGAQVWPDPETAEGFDEALSRQVNAETALPMQEELSFEMHEERPTFVAKDPAIPAKADDNSASAAEELFATVRALVTRTPAPMTDAEVAAYLRVSKSQARDWLERLVEEGTLTKLSKPTRYAVVRENS